MVLHGCFSQLARFSWDMKHAFSMSSYHIQIEAVAAFLVTFGAHKNVLFIIKVKILMPNKYSYSPPTTQFCRVLGLEMLSYF